MFSTPREFSTPLGRSLKELCSVSAPELLPEILARSLGGQSPSSGSSPLSKGGCLLPDSENRAHA